MRKVTPETVGEIDFDPAWDFGSDNGCLMHDVHAYPAKFPAFIASKAFSYAKEQGVTVNDVADIFCGCGTVALESEMHGKNFWGCDINPVATLIARAKSSRYDIGRLLSEYDSICRQSGTDSPDIIPYKNANPRIRYWFSENSYVALARIKNSILRQTDKGIYRDAFLCIFSSCLKACSRWLTKSIKPQVDPDKPEPDVARVFNEHAERFIEAAREIDEADPDSTDIRIEECNILTETVSPCADLVISSPPYVTSYEYADLHQLSTLWLDYAQDYRDLRKGSIGSTYHSEGFSFEKRDLNTTATNVLEELQQLEFPRSKKLSIARYYLDMQQAVHQCMGLLRPGGMVLFVIGDTEYRGVKITNAAQLVESLQDEGFEDIRAGKRHISRKILTPYRDKNGRFTSDKSQRQIYHMEYVISGRKAS